ncbi:hypothetical protein GCM10022249_26230 [Enteractinococcus coprophilus]
MPEFGATHPTDQDPIERINDPKNPTTIAGQACIVVPRWAFSKVVINSFQWISLISMTLGINVSPDIGRLNIDTWSKEKYLGHHNTPTLRAGFCGL